jgi:hypothetical protein
VFYHKTRTANVLNCFGNGDRSSYWRSNFQKIRCVSRENQSSSLYKSREISTIRHAYDFSLCFPQLIINEFLKNIYKVYIKYIQTTKLKVTIYALFIKIKNIELLYVVYVDNQKQQQYIKYYKILKLLILLLK